MRVHKKGDLTLHKGKECRLNYPSPSGPMYAPLGVGPGGPSRQKVALHATVLRLPLFPPAACSFCSSPLKGDMKLHVSSGYNAHRTLSGSRNRNIIHTRGARPSCRKCHQRNVT